MKHLSVLLMGPFLIRWNSLSSFSVSSSSSSLISHGGMKSSKSCSEKFRTINISE